MCFSQFEALITGLCLAPSNYKPHKITLIPEKLLVCLLFSLDFVQPHKNAHSSQTKFIAQHMAKVLVVVADPIA